MNVYLFVLYADDWKSIFGDPTKFGFGALTVFFALILLFQHMLYRSNNSDKKSSRDNSTPCKIEKGIGIILCTRKWGTVEMYKLITRARLE